MNISKITLGTAQLGMQYGIANKTKPDLRKSNQILNYAINHGINSFDTAQIYGDSEQILGNFFKTKKKTPTIISKLPKIKLEKRNPSFQEVYDSIKEMIEESTQKLQMKKLSICLLHNPLDLDRYNGLVEKSLIKLKENNLVNKIGISAYTSKEVERFLENKKLETIQIPINVLDTRLIKNGLLQELNSEKKIVFARSIFLQGLLILNKNKLPKKISRISKHLSKVEEICDENNLTIQQLAFLFVRDLKEITSLTVGVDSVSQLKENIRILSMPTLSTSVYEEILNIGKIPDKLLNPSKW